MRVVGVLIIAAILSACGVDGEPIRPSVGTNVRISNKGTSVGTHVLGTSGNVSVGVGLGL